jgi:hypothetical protein
MTIELDDTVTWPADPRPAKVIGIFTQPAVIIEWEDGTQKTVGIDKLTKTAPPLLPVEPGYYIAERPSYGDHVVVELLNSPAGQWVDSGDREYLTIEDVASMGPLIRLERRADTAKAVLDRVRATGLHELLLAANPANTEDLDTIARDFGIKP